MRDTPLSDDPDDWPDDPYALFGLPHDTNPRDLKRAYHALLRTYPPERFPAEFMKIRAAFERLSSWVGRDDVSRTAPRPTVSPDPPPTSETTSGESPLAEEPSLEPVPAMRPPAYSAKTLKRLWAVAVEGKREEAYRQLLGWWNERPQDPQLAVRLFWLLEWDRSLDPVRTPDEILLKSLTPDGWSVTWQVFLERVERFPELALSDAVRDLIVRSSGSSHLQPLLRSRWRAACRLGRFEAMRDDLDLLRPVLLTMQADPWLFAVSAAMDFLAWEDAPPAASLWDWCRRELEELSDYQLDHEGLFDNNSLLQLLREKHRRDSAEPDEPTRIGLLKSMVQTEWTGPPWEVREQLRKLLRVWGKYPQLWLEALDAAGPIYVARLQNALQHIWVSPLSLTEEAAARRAAAIREQFSMASPLRGLPFRLAVLQTALREGASLQELIPMVWDDESKAGRGQRIVDLSNDAALSVMIKGIRAYEGHHWSH